VQGGSLQGASRTSGGIIRGKALGNVLSLADAPEVLSEKVKPVKGEVRIFTSLADPTHLKPVLVAKINTTTSLIETLNQMRKKYLPIASKFFKDICH